MTEPSSPLPSASLLNTGIEERLNSLTSYRWFSMGMEPEDWSKKSGSINADYLKREDVHDLFFASERQQQQLKNAIERTLNCDCLICESCSKELEYASGLKATASYDWRPTPRSPLEVVYSKEIQQKTTADAETISRLGVLVHMLKRGSCWCDVGIGNPMMHGRHSLACVEAQDVVARLPDPQ